MDLHFLLSHMASCLNVLGCVYLRVNTFTLKVFLLQSSLGKRRSLDPKSLRTLPNVSDTTKSVLNHNPLNF